MSKPFKARPLDEQTVVITGATSGIGFATAKLAASKGARVVLAARNDAALKRCVEQIERSGGKALGVSVDVAKPEDLVRLRDEALATFGRIDTWVNNAATSIFGYLLDGDVREEKILFETNFWGTLQGSRMAIECMRDTGGVLINLGSEVSVAAQPLLGMYSASKHALKAITDALRSELRDQNIPIEVCLIRPTAIDTPFAEHALNRLDHGEPSLPEPRYSPEVAADAIVHCMTSPERDVYVGGPARLAAILDTFFPKVKDIYAESQMKNLKKGTRDGHTEEQESLHHPAEEEGSAVGDNKGGRARESSLYTEVSTLNILKSVTDTVKESIKELRKH